MLSNSSAERLLADRSVCIVFVVHTLQAWRSLSTRASSGMSNVSAALCASSQSGTRASSREIRRSSVCRAMRRTLRRDALSVMGWVAVCQRETKWSIMLTSHIDHINASYVSLMSNSLVKEQGFGFDNTWLFQHQINESVRFHFSASCTYWKDLTAFYLYVTPLVCWCVYADTICVWM